MSNATYQWSPNQNISCVACDSPTVSPSTNTTYTVIATNLFGCSDTSTVDVVIDSILPTPTISCGNNSPTSTVFNWVPVIGSAGYVVSVNGGAPQLIPAAQDSFELTGMPIGSCASISIYAQSGNTCQDGMPDSLVCCAQNCPTIGQAVITPGGPTVFCTGQNVSLTSDPAITYLWSTGQTTQSITVSTTNTYGYYYYGCIWMFRHSFHFSTSYAWTFSDYYTSVFVGFM